MSDIDQAEPSKSRLPSPGRLLVLLLLVIVVSISGWMGWRVHRQRASLEYFEQIWGHVETEAAKPVWLHDLVADKLGEERAAGFTDITYIRCMHITDDGMQRLSGLTSLERLNLYSADVTDAGLQYLSNLTNLRQLDLSYTQITDDGLQHLRHLFNLEELSLYGTEVTDDGLQFMEDLANLKTLNLCNTQITDAGLQHLSSLSNLQRLSVDDRQVTEAGVEQLKAQLPGVFVEILPLRALELMGYE